jgi:hypothetical protein
MNLIAAYEMVAKHLSDNAYPDVMCPLNKTMS